MNTVLLFFLLAFVLNIGRAKVGWWVGFWLLLMIDLSAFLLLALFAPVTAPVIA